MTRYALANHVFVCLQDEHVVFLDVHEDRYFSLEAARTRGLEHLVRGWPVRSSAPQSADTIAAAELATKLSEKGLLTSELRIGKEATPTCNELPAEQVYADGWDDAPRVEFRTICEFIGAALFASFTLRFISFERMVRHAQRRRQRAQGSSRNGVDTPVLQRARAQQLVAIFTWLRPYFFTARDACLFEALALGHFLSRFGIDSRWVFGVQARPFAAHCWLQWEGVVLNDTVEHVSRYKPIMVI